MELKIVDLIEKVYKKNLYFLERMILKCFVFEFQFEWKKKKKIEVNENLK
jgi:hypothetical protein